jgi:hypothetical protein
MSRSVTLASLFIAALLCASLLASGTPPMLQSLSRMPRAFTKNMGQWDDRVLFRANSGGATMWFTREGVTYQFTRRIDSGNGDNRRGTLHVPAGTRSVPLHGAPQLAVGDDHLGDTRDSIEQLILTANFVGANPNPEVIAEGQMEYKYNYFIGNDPSKWHTDVPNYEAVTLKDIYPGIDLKYSGDGNGQAAYEFVASPGADIAQIKVAYEGAEETSVDDEGNLIQRTKWGDMTAAIKSPTDGVLSGSTSCVWRRSSSTTSSPDLARGGDVRQALAEKTGTLALTYSTYFGGSGNDFVNGIAVDRSGCAYVTGFTDASSFPTLNGYDTTYSGTEDVFIAKFSAAGNSLIYSTFLGGSKTENGWGIAVDSSGCAYVTGYTYSTNFPMLNAYDSTFNEIGNDIFVTKLSATGSSLIYSTFLGGSISEYAWDIAVDDLDCAYVTGSTASSDFPTRNPYDSSFGGGSDDVFVTKFSAAGNTLIYSTFLGGSCVDIGYRIAVDDADCAYVTGSTTSPDFPTRNAYDASFGGFYRNDVFVTKLSAFGNSLVYSTYLGGSGNDLARGIDVDYSGCAYVTGETESSDFPTQNAHDGSIGGTGDAFATKLSAAGDLLIYSTFLGGSSFDCGYDNVVDGSGCAYVTGITLSSDFPTSNALDVSFNAGHVFVTKYSAAGDELVYSTFLGRPGGPGIAIDGSGCAYVTSLTGSSDFPTHNAYDSCYNGGLDGFITKLTWTPGYSCGDVNTDEEVNLIDAVFLINYIFVGGSAPQQLSLADVDCSGRINIADVVRLINYIFSGGPAPCAECE